MLKKIESMKKATGWWARWRATRGQKATDKVQLDRGKWGYIPPSSLFVPKKWLVAVNVCLVVILLTNSFILAVQVYNYFEKKSHAAKSVATAPNTAAARAGAAKKPAAAGYVGGRGDPDAIADRMGDLACRPFSS